MSEPIFKTRVEEIIYRYGWECRGEIWLPKKQYCDAFHISPTAIDNDRTRKNPTHKSMKIGGKVWVSVTAREKRIARVRGGSTPRTPLTIVPGKVALSRRKSPPSRKLPPENDARRIIAEIQAGKLRKRPLPFNENLLSRQVLSGPHDPQDVLLASFGYGPLAKKKKSKRPLPCK